MYFQYFGQVKPQAEAKNFSFIKTLFYHGKLFIFLSATTCEDRR